MQQQGDVGAMSTERITTRQRAAVQREVSRLLDDLAPERPPPRRDLPLPDVTLHRSPGRCILQGTTSAVSVSWLPGRPDDDSFGTMLVIAWKGVVSVPGAARRPGAEPQALQTLELHPVEADDGAWSWHDETAKQPLPTGALASYCRDLLQQ